MNFEQALDYFQKQFSREPFVYAIGSRENVIMVRVASLRHRPYKIPEFFMGYKVTLVMDGDPSVREDSFGRK